MSYVGNKPAQTTIPADDSVTTAMLKDDAVTADKVANAINTEISANTAKVTNATHTGDVTGATALTIAAGAVDVAMLSATGSASSSTVLYGDGTWKAEPTTDTTGLETDIALLGFKVASNGSLAAYNLQDQFVDDFQDASGVDASASTNESRDSTGKYYSGASEATGGTITTYSSGGTDYVINTFTESGDFVSGQSAAADILIVGGGGSGGYGQGSAGGGAGGFVYYDQTTVAAGTHAVVVGPGGQTDYGAANPAANGTNSSFASLTAAVGGGGGSQGDTSTAGPGASGGSGGGGGARNSQPGGSGTSNQGNSGGSSTSSSNSAEDAGGGGGGASASGGNGSGNTAGNGGAGITEGATVYDWEAGSGTVTFPAAFKVGSGGNLSYAGGGGGGSEAGFNGTGGVGGGGSGGNTAGTDGTGGGGSGRGGGTALDGMSGGDGVVIVRSVAGSMSSYNNMTLVSNTQTALSEPSTADIVMTYTNGAGTATVNTDLKAYVTRDDGTTYTQVTLVSEGTTGGHEILVAHNVDVSSQPSGSALRYKVETLNQSVSKQTRIQAVSLGWL